MSVEYLGLSSRKASNQKGIRTYVYQHKLQTTVNTDDEVAVGNNPNIPRIGSQHPTDAAAYVQGIDVDNHEPWAGWLVTVTYSTERELNEDPTAEPALTEWDGEQFQAVVVFDKDGDAVLNSAGDPFDPPVLRDDSRLISTTTKNMASVPTWIMNYADAVNSDAFTIDGFSVDVGQAKMQRPKVSKPQTRNDITFREVTFTIHYKEDGWLAEPLDVGFRKIDGSARVPITDADGNPVTAPVPLDGAGGELAAPDPTTAVTLPYTIYKTLPFSVLPLT